MVPQKSLLVYVLLLTGLVLGKHKKIKPKKLVSPSSRGLQCYNCLSFDHPGCWDPEHPDHANLTVGAQHRLLHTRHGFPMHYNHVGISKTGGNGAGDRAGARADLRLGEGLLQEDRLLQPLQQTEQGAVGLGDLLEGDGRTTPLYPVQVAPLRRQRAVLNDSKVGQVEASPGTVDDLGASQWLSKTPDHHRLLAASLWRFLEPGRARLLPHSGHRLATSKIFKNPRRSTVQLVPISAAKAERRTCLGYYV